MSATGYIFVPFFQKPIDFFYYFKLFLWGMMTAMEALLFWIWFWMCLGATCHVSIPFFPLETVCFYFSMFVFLSVITKNNIKIKMQNNLSDTSMIHLSIYVAFSWNHLICLKIVCLPRVQEVIRPMALQVKPKSSRWVFAVCMFSTR